MPKDIFEHWIILSQCYLMHQSIPSTNIPPRQTLGKFFGGSQKPCSRAKNFCKNTAPGCKMVPTLGEHFSCSVSWKDVFLSSLIFQHLRVIQCSDSNERNITYIAREPIYTNKHRTERRIRKFANGLDPSWLLKNSLTRNSTTARATGISSNLHLKDKQYGGYENNT